MPCSPPRVTAAHIGEGKFAHIVGKGAAGTCPVFEHGPEAMRRRSPLMAAMGGPCRIGTHRDTAVGMAQEVVAAPDAHRPFKGLFNVHVPPALHRAAALCATRDGAALNEVVVRALREYLAT